MDLMERVIGCKFGGNTLGDGQEPNPEKILADARAVKKLRDQGNAVVVTTSGPGDWTDIFLAKAKMIHKGAQGPALAAVLQTGEIVSMGLFALALESLGVPTKIVYMHQLELEVDGKDSSNATVRKVKNPGIIIDALQKGFVVLVPGFQGMDAEKNVVLLGRGGSDVTQVVVIDSVSHAFVEAECWFFKDVNGIRLATPKYVPNALRVSRITNSNMLDVAREGAQVLNARAVELAGLLQRRLWVGLSPSHGGTMKMSEGTEIVPGASREDIEGELVRPFCALVVKDLARIRVSNLPDRQGTLELLDTAVQIIEVPVEAQLQDAGKHGVAAVSYVVQEEDLWKVAMAFDGLKKGSSTKKDMSKIRIESASNLTGLTIISSTMRSGRRPLLLRSEALVNVANIIMAWSAGNVMTTVVDRSRAKKAAQALARKFNLVEK